MYRKLSHILLLLFAIGMLSAKAQENTDAAGQLQKQLSVYLSEHPMSNLYLHLDKNIYAPDETIWFKAYLLADTVTDNKVLYVRIVDEHKEIVLSGQFPMYDIRAHGSISLYTEGQYGDKKPYIGRYVQNPDKPKTLEEGRYTLYAYTDRMLSYGDTNVFVQPIRIRKKIGRKLEAEARISDTTQLVRGGKVQVMVRIREDGNLAKNIKGEYELTADGKEIKYGRLATNQFGEAFLNFTYPELADGQSLKVKLLFARDNDFAELSLNLPHEGNPLKVSVRPEGDRMLAGVAGKVAIQVLDIHDNPVETELLVKEEGRLLFKVRTDKLGIATIGLKPGEGPAYTVETTGAKKQTFPFPQVIKPEGYSLKLNNGKDGCTVTVYNKNQRGTALLVLRSAREILWSTALAIAPGDSSIVPVPAGDFPKDILSLSLFDRENRPQAERLFLNREEEDYKVAVHTDLQDYGLQKKVTVTLSAADREGNPVVANLSVAAVEKNRTDSAEHRNILQYWHYRPFGRAGQNRFLAAKSASEVDGLLVARNWGNNQWNKISTYQAKGPPIPLNNVNDAIGQVTKKKFKLKEIFMESPEVNLSLTELNKYNILSFKRIALKLDENDTFIVPVSSLLSRKGEEWALDIYTAYMSEKLFHYNFLVHWKDHDIQFDSTVVKSGLLYGEEPMNSFASFETSAVSPFNFKGVNQLAEVTIGGKEETVRKTLTLRNCMNSAEIMYNSIIRTGGDPKYRYTVFIKGQPYNWGFNQYGTPRVITYLGCGRFRDINYIKNITIPEEFPLPDHDSDPSGNEDTRSTVYWNPNIVTGADGIATFSFFTSDVQGEFGIVAQGLEVNTFKPLMGTGSFKVTTVIGK